VKVITVIPRHTAMQNFTLPWFYSSFSELEVDVPTHKIYTTHTHIEEFLQKKALKILKAFFCKKLFYV